MNTENRKRALLVMEHLILAHDLCLKIIAHVEPESLTAKNYTALLQALNKITPLAEAGANETKNYITFDRI